MSQKPVILQTAKLQGPIDEVTRDYTVLKLFEAEDKAAFLAEHKAVVTAAIGNVLDAATIAALPNLKVFANFGVGYDGADTDAARAHGVRVTNTPDILTEEVADTAMAILLAAIRQVPQAQKYLVDGRWEREGPYPLQPLSLYTSTVGVLGLGRIGAAIAKRCALSGAQIAYTGRAEKAGYPDYRFVPTLIELAEESDILLVACKGGEETRHLVTRDVLQALGPKGLIVNIARGTVIDETALVTALEQNEIWGAALDVFEEEPKVPEALKRMTDRVVITPHIGSSTLATRRGMANVMMANIAAFFAGKPLLTEVPETREI